MEQEIIILDEFKRILNLWWLVVLCTIVGGAIGFAFRYVTPPMYESKATIHVAVDFTNTLLNTQPFYSVRIYDEDQAMQVIQAAFVEAIPQVISYSKSLNLSMDEATFLQNSSIERMLALWDIRFRFKDPTIAQKVVNYWLQQSLIVLKQKKQDGTLKPYLTYDVVANANLPTGPTYYQTNILVLAGGLIGLIIGMLLTNLPIFKAKH